jgi:hypothetical protein
MLIRLLADVDAMNYKRGELKAVPDEVGRDLIANSLAAEIKNTYRAINNSAHEALNEARRRDEPKEQTCNAR